MKGLAPALALTLVTTVGLAFAVLGTVGAGLAGWQLTGWLLLGNVPQVADAWRHAGLTGQLFVALFDWLPLVLALAIAFHAFVAWLGVGLLWRRPGARRTALAFACGWAGLAVLGWLAARLALADLARGYPERAAFAHAAGALATEVTLLNVGLAVLLVLLLVQPAVRAQFSAGR